MKMLQRTLISSSIIALMLIIAGCNKARDKNQNVQGPPAGMPGMPPGFKGPGFPGPGFPGGKTGPIGEIMAKLTKGPESLTEVIGEELKSDAPPWDKLQAQTKEFTELAASMSKHEPPKGSKESWKSLTSAYSASAATLAKAVSAKDKNAAVAAHQVLATSCMACHKQHRGMGFGPGFGPPGGFGKFGPGGPKGPGGFNPPPGPDKGNKEGEK
jgi:hypothetical protein